MTTARGHKIAAVEVRRNGETIRVEAPLVVVEGAQVAEDAALGAAVAGAAVEPEGLLVERAPAVEVEPLITLNARGGIHLGRGNGTIPGRPRTDPAGPASYSGCSPQFRYYRAHSRA